MKPSQKAIEAALEQRKVSWKSGNPIRKTTAILEAAYAIDVDPVLAEKGKQIERLTIDRAHDIPLSDWVEALKIHKAKIAVLEAENTRLSALEPGNKDLRDTLILRNETIDLLIQENQLLKSNLENANENWRRVLEERDKLESEFADYRSQFDDE